MSGCSQSPAGGTAFPIAEPAFGEAASTRLLSRPPWSLSFPCCCPTWRPCAQEGSGHLPPLLPVAVTRSRSSSSMLLCTSASWDLASVCPGCEPLPLQLPSTRLRHPEHPFLPPGVALHIPFPELFCPDLYWVTGMWVPYLAVVAQPLRLGVFPSMTSICPSVAIANFCSIYSHTGASFKYNNR